MKPVKTSRHLTLYEFVKIVGIRATQLQYGAESHIHDPSVDPEDYLLRAQLELAHRKLSFILKRPLTCVNNCTEFEFVSINALSFDCVPKINDEFVDPIDDDPMETSCSTTYVLNDHIHDDALTMTTLSKKICVYAPEQQGDRCIRFVTTMVKKMLRCVVNDTGIIVNVVHFTMDDKEKISHISSDGSILIHIKVAVDVQYIKTFDESKKEVLCTIRHVFRNVGTEPIPGEIHGYPDCIPDLMRHRNIFCIASVDLNGSSNAIVFVLVMFPTNKYKIRNDNMTHTSTIHKTFAGDHIEPFKKHSKIHVRIREVKNYKERSNDADAISLICIADFYNSITIV